MFVRYLSLNITERAMVRMGLEGARKGVGWVKRDSIVLVGS